MKTLAIKKTDNQNYVVFYPSIPGQQSREDVVFILSSSGDLVAEKTYHDIWAWKDNCHLVCMIGGVEKGKEINVARKAIELNIDGYTTARLIRDGKSFNLLPPLNLVKLPKQHKRHIPSRMEVPVVVNIQRHLQD